MSSRMRKIDSIITEQLPGRQHAKDCECDYCLKQPAEDLRGLAEVVKKAWPFEQPNIEIMLVKTIQSLMTVVNDNLEKLNEATKFLSCHRNSLVLQALEEIDLFQRTTLYELRKEFE